MRCDRARELMDRYVIEGSLGRRASCLRSSLGVCHDCQQQMADLRTTCGDLQGEPSPPVPKEFVDRVMARARREGQLSSPRRVFGGPSHSVGGSERGKHGQCRRGRRSRTPARARAGRAELAACLPWSDPPIPPRRRNS